MASFLGSGADLLPRTGVARGTTLANHPERERIEALYNEMLPAPGTFGCAAIIMTLTEERLAADLEMLTVFKAFTGQFRLEDVRTAVRALRRSGSRSVAESLTAEGVQALVDLGLGYDEDEKLVAETGYAQRRRLQELIVTRPHDAGLVRTAFDRKVFDPEQVAVLVADLRAAAPAVAEGTL